MGAIAATLLALLRAGDHLVASRYIFGNTNSLLGTAEGLGIAVDKVDASSVEAVAAAIRPETRMVLVETIANPRTQVADLGISRGSANCATSAGSSTWSTIRSPRRLCSSRAQLVRAW